MKDLRTILPLEKFKEYYFLLNQDDVGGGKTLLDILHEHLLIQRSQIDKHYEENPAVIAFWAGLYHREQYRLVRIKRQFEKLYARHYINFKAAISSRVSETELKHRVSKVPAIADMQEKVDLLTYKVGLLDAIVSVMKERNNNVINLGASIRKEMGARDSARGEVVHKRKLQREQLKSTMRKGRSNG